jgi:hypothetical protein
MNSSLRVYNTIYIWTPTAIPGCTRHRHLDPGMRPLILVTRDILLGMRLLILVRRYISLRTRHLIMVRRYISLGMRYAICVAAMESSKATTMHLEHESLIWGIIQFEEDEEETVSFNRIELLICHGYGIR